MDKNSTSYGDTHEERVRELIETGASIRRTGRPILAAYRRWMLLPFLIDIVAVDSVPALEPPEQKDTDASASRGAHQGRLLSEALRRLAAGVDRMGTVLLFGNRTTPAAEADRRSHGRGAAQQRTGGVHPRPAERRTVPCMATES